MAPAVLEHPGAAASTCKEVLTWARLVDREFERVVHSFRGRKATLGLRPESPIPLRPLRRTRVPPWPGLRMGRLNRMDPRLRLGSTPKVGSSSLRLGREDRGVVSVASHSKDTSNIPKYGYRRDIFCGSPNLERKDCQRHSNDRG